MASTLLGLQAQLFHAQGEDAVVGLSNTHHGRLHHVLEQMVEAKLHQHLVDVAIEIAYQDHGIRLVQLLQHLTAMACGFLHLGIKLVEHGLVLLVEHSLVGTPKAVLAQIFHLQAKLYAQRGVEIVMRLDDGVSAQRALRIDISVAKLLLRNGHLMLLVSAPQQFSPVATRCVERASIIENISFNHLRFLFFIYDVSQKQGVAPITR